MKKVYAIMFLIYSLGVVVFEIYTLLYEFNYPYFELKDFLIIIFKLLLGIIGFVSGIEIIRNKYWGIQVAVGVILLMFAQFFIIHYSPIETSISYSDASEMIMIFFPFTIIYPFILLICLLYYLIKEKIEAKRKNLEN